MTRLRYIQDRETGELFPAAEYQAKRAASRGPMIAPDIEPYKSIVTGETITSRSRHREHLRQHGCEELGNDMPGWMREKQYEERHGRK